MLRLRWVLSDVPLLPTTSYHNNIILPLTASKVSPDIWFHLPPLILPPPCVYFLCRYCSSDKIRGNRHEPNIPFLYTVLAFNCTVCYGKARHTNRRDYRNATSPCFVAQLCAVTRLGIFCTKLASCHFPTALKYREVPQSHLEVSHIKETGSSGHTSTRKSGAALRKAQEF